MSDPELDDGLRSDVIAATKSFSQLFLPPQLITVWDSTRVSCLPDAKLKTLTWFGQTARRHRPLRVVSDEERAELIRKIDDAIQELASDPLSDWTNAPLTDGLLRLRIVLQFFKFFGHEMAIEELLLFNRKVEAVRDIQQGGQSFLGQLELRGFSRILEITVLLGTLFILPDQVVTANDRYAGWMQRLILSSTQIPPERRLLPPPVAALPSSAGVLRHLGKE